MAIYSRSIYCFWNGIYSCFSWGGNLYFLHFLQTSFITSNYWMWIVEELHYWSRMWGLPPPNHSIISVAVKIQFCAPFEVLVLVLLGRVGKTRYRDERETHRWLNFFSLEREHKQRERVRERERERVHWRKTIKWRIRNFFPSFRESWVVQLHSASSLFLSLSYPPILSFTLRPFLSISSLHISASFFCLLTSVFFLLSSIFCLLSSVFYLLSSFYLSLSLSYIHPIYLHTVYFDLSIYIFALMS